MASKHEFADRGYTVKKETERALEDPEWFARLMREAHPVGNGPEPLQIRLQGNIRDVLLLAGQLCAVLGLEAKIRKREVDKTERVGNYDADNIFVYLSARSGRSHDDVVERARALPRIVCPRCRMLVSVRETREGRCGDCGAELER